jgi:EmrB/QacA subfamily drug resistance transporter
MDKISEDSDGKKRAIPQLDPRLERWTLIIAILTTSVAFIDSSLVGVALPSIGRDMNTSPTELQWVVNAFMLPLSAMLLLAGSASDHFGRRSSLLAGLACYTAGSVLAAIAPSITLLLGARAFQGIGAAILMPTSVSLLARTFSGKRLGRAIGIWAGVTSAAMAVGPPFGGWLVETFSWRAIFWLGPPIGILSFLLTLHFVGDRERGDRGIDWVGGVLAAVMLGALAWSLSHASARRMFDHQSFTGLFVAGGAFAAFLFVEYRRGERAMLPLALFRSPPFVGLSIVTLLFYATSAVQMFLLPYVLILVGGYTPIQAGLALMPSALIVALGSRFMGGIADKYGPRLPLFIATLIAALGQFWFAQMEPASSYLLGPLPGIILYSLGMVGVVAPLNATVVTLVDKKMTGTASGFNSALSRTGGLIAVALAGAVIASSGDGLTDAFHVAAIVAAALCVTAAIVTLLSLQKVTLSS